METSRQTDIRNGIGRRGQLFRQIDRLDCYGRLETDRQADRRNRRQRTWRYGIRRYRAERQAEATVLEDAGAELEPRTASEELKTMAQE